MLTGPFSSTENEKTASVRSRNVTVMRLKHKTKDTPVLQYGYFMLHDLSTLFLAVFQLANLC